MNYTAGIVRGLQAAISLLIMASLECLNVHALNFTTSFCCHKKLPFCHCKLNGPPTYHLVVPESRMFSGSLVKKAHDHCSFHLLAISIPSASVPTLASMA